MSTASLTIGFPAVTCRKNNYVPKRIGHNPPVHATVDLEIFSNKMEIPGNSTG
jgi:hypothetical protein